MWHLIICKSLLSVSVSQYGSIIYKLSEGNEPLVCNKANGETWPTKVILIFLHPFGPAEPEKASPCMKQAVLKKEVSKDFSHRNSFSQEIRPCKLKGWATQRKSAAVVFPYAREANLLRKTGTQASYE